MSDFVAIITCYEILLQDMRAIHFSGSATAG